MNHSDTPDLDATSISSAAQKALTKEEFVARRLREMVVSGELQPGTWLRQQQIADRLEVSATPVREALRRLVSEGFLESEPHVGVKVLEPNLDQRDEVYEIRQVLEGDLAAHAAEKVTAAQTAVLRQLNEEFQKACEDQEYVEARLLNFRLHHVVWELAQRPVTLEIVNTLWAKFPFGILGHVPGRAERTVVEHEELILSLESGDPARAATAVFDHIRSGRRDYLALLATATGNEHPRTETPGAPTQP